MELSAPESVSTALPPTYTSSPYTEAELPWNVQPINTTCVPVLRTASAPACRRPHPSPRRTARGCGGVRHGQRAAAGRRAGEGSAWGAHLLRRRPVSRAGLAPPRQRRPASRRCAGAPAAQRTEAEFPTKDTPEKSALALPMMAAEPPCRSTSKRARKGTAGGTQAQAGAKGGAGEGAHLLSPSPSTSTATREHAAPRLSAVRATPPGTRRFCLAAARARLAQPPWRARTYVCARHAAAPPPPASGSGLAGGWLRSGEACHAWLAAWRAGGPKLPCLPARRGCARTSVT